MSIGHSDASFEVASAAFRAGATMATHLFNAMSQIGNRDPGVVGAALASGAVWAGLIADGIHVHPETVRIARAAKLGPGRLFLVSDSMSQAGTGIESFEFDGRMVLRRNGALRLADGTLAGADLTMDQAVVSALHMGLPLDEVLWMSAAYPAAALTAPDIGHLRPGANADFLHLVDTRVARTFLGSVPIARA